MTMTTSYGSWAYNVPGEGLTVRDGIVEALGEYADDYDLDGLERAYRDAIHDALPPGVMLCGEEFIGPAPVSVSLNHPVTCLGDQDYAAIVSSVDLWKIAARFER